MARRWPAATRSALRWSWPSRASCTSSGTSTRETGSIGLFAQDERHGRQRVCYCEMEMREPRRFRVGRNQGGEIVWQRGHACFWGAHGKHQAVSLVVLSDEPIREKGHQQHKHYDRDILQHCGSPPTG